MFLGVRLCLLLPIAALAWSLVVMGETGKAITPAARVRRDDPIGSRRDFVGYSLASTIPVSKQMRAFAPRLRLTIRSRKKGLPSFAMDGSRLSFP
jgi:hypothetical protein